MNTGVCPELVYDFFAVTRNCSVYHFLYSDEDGSLRADLIAKIAENGIQRVFLNSSINIYNSNVVALTPYGIVLYKRDLKKGILGPEDIPRPKRALQTSPPVALFFDYKTALGCLDTLEWKKEKTKTCDPRWRETTLEVLNRIGENHPAFQIIRVWNSRPKYHWPK